MSRVEKEGERGNETKAGFEDREKSQNKLRQCPQHPPQAREANRDGDRVDRRVVDRVAHQRRAKENEVSNVDLDNVPPSRVMNAAPPS